MDGSEHVEESYFNKAIILGKLRKFTESQESFDKTFELNPNLKNSMEGMHLYFIEKLMILISEKYMSMLVIKIFLLEKSKLITKFLIIILPRQDSKD